MTAWADAHNVTDAHIAKLHGIAIVLDEIAVDWPHLDTPDPLAQGIKAMIRTIREDVEKLNHLHDIEWEAKTAQA